MTRGWHVFQARWLLPFEYQTQKGLVFKCVLYFSVRYSNRNIIYREIWGAFDRGNENVTAILWKTRLVQRLPDLVKYWRNRTWNKTSEYWIFKNLNSKCLVFKCSYHSNTRHLFVHFRQSFLGNDSKSEPLCQMVIMQIMQPIWKPNHSANSPLTN